jgi:hypothetical protein
MRKVKTRHRPIIRVSEMMGMVRRPENGGLIRFSEDDQ